MAASYTTLTTLRTTRPNPLALLTALRAAVDATVGATEAVGGWRMKKATLWTAPQIAAAQNALDTCAADTLQLQAQQKIDSMDIFDKAIILALIDELNLLRAWVVAFKAATAAATSLANLQTRVAALSDLPDRTVPQAIAAVRTKAGQL
jgi:hypothetical protein